MIHYNKPAGVAPIHTDRAIFLSTPEGGRVLIDKMVLQLWQTAQQNNRDKILADFHTLGAEPTQVLAGLACLAEAGLLERSGVEDLSSPILEFSGDLVSVIIVSYNSRTWLETCLISLLAQTYKPLEIILVDNASQDDSAGWVEAHYPQVQIVRLSNPHCLAQAFNLGIRAAGGRYYLLLNPDLELKPDAVAHLVNIARQSPACAAVSAKLRLMWARSFLNGLGNLVGAVSWGTDIGLGHLDLGQLDHLDEAPSACFAAALIPAGTMQVIGPLDEGFPMYYEDSEWCYRARLFGYTIQTAPQAVIYHAFSARLPAQETTGLSPLKLRRVTHGRLRFITRINGAGYFWSFLFSYLLEDVLRLLGSLVQARWDQAGAVLGGWNDYIRSLPALHPQRKQIQSRRRISDRTLYRIQRSAPPPRIQSGLPQLNWDAICSEYLPLMLTGRTRRLPEIDPLGPHSGGMTPGRGIWQRVKRIWRIEGPRALFRRFAREIQWKWMQP